MKRRPYNAAVGARVRERRLTLGMTLDDVAGELGLNKSNILRYETGESGIEVETLAALGRCLKCPPEKFLEGIEERVK
jgi:transcriptional regulator with XRE-family HTH domain